MKSISCIIPNYNGKFLLETNLPFLYKALKKSCIDDYEVIVCDDASSDTSIDFLEKNYPDIKLIKNQKNLGFSGNINTGIRYASKELVFLLNNDVRLSDDYFVPLMKYFEKEDTFGVMGRIVNAKTGNLQDAAKYPVKKTGKIIASENYLCDAKNVYTVFLSGANALIDRQKLNSIGGFNEIFNPFYSEDVDLSLTAWSSGYKLYYDDKAICYHDASKTIKQGKNKAELRKVNIFIYRNKLFLNYLHLQGINFLFFQLNYLLKFVFSLIIFNSVFLKAYWEYLKSLKKLKKIKKQRKKSLKYSYKEVINFMLNHISKHCKNIKIFKA